MNRIASTPSGRIEGAEGRGVVVFRGIPYGRAARGPLRFQPPEPVAPWAGTRSARHFGASSPQSAPMLRWAQAVIGAPTAAQSQDCLVLNVWTPRVDERRRPVMVWIHGGAFVLGSGSAALYDGSSLAANGDVVVVTVNYRLGAFGFLDLSDRFPGRTAANCGLRDQIAALRWVRTHIASFGGDPENVTIFGESAGGMSVGTLLGTPAARGLFHRAILQSGAAHNVSTPSQAARVAGFFLEELGVATLEALQEAEVSTVLAAQRRTALRLGFTHGTLPWQPSLDGDLLPELPLRAIARGASRDVPVLVGTNRDEWRLFTLGDRRLGRLDADGLRRRIQRALPDVDASGAALAPRAFAHYTALKGRGAPRTPGQTWEVFQSDRVFHHPARHLALLHAAHTPRTFAYVFGWSPPGRRIGACHGIEIPFVFGGLQQSWLRPLATLAPRARELSDAMQRAWLGFAKRGDPGHDGLPAWSRFDPDERGVMWLAPRCRMELDPFAERLRFWEALETGQREVARAAG